MLAFGGSVSGSAPSGGTGHSRELWKAACSPRSSSLPLPARSFRGLSIDKFHRSAMLKAVLGCVQVFRAALLSRPFSLCLGCRLGSIEGHRYRTIIGHRPNPRLRWKCLSGVPSARFWAAFPVALFYLALNSPLDSLAASVSRQAWIWCQERLRNLGKVCGLGASG
jgi:hypothetical protein